MTVVNIADAKTNLSKYLKKVEQGETVILARRNKHIAEIRPLKKRSNRRRPFGLCVGDFVVPPEFDEPLPESIVDAFEGK